MTRPRDAEIDDVCLAATGAAGGTVLLFRWVFHSDFCVGDNETRTAKPTSRTDVSLLLRSGRWFAQAIMGCPVLCDVRIARYGPKQPCVPSSRFQPQISRCYFAQKAALCFCSELNFRRCNLPPRPVACGGVCLRGSERYSPWA